MTETFILQNHLKLFWGKSKEWVDGYDANAVYKTPYKDEAINQMVEISAKDFMQRIKVLECQLDEKGLPHIDAAIMPEPLPKAPKIPKQGDDLFNQVSDHEAANESNLIEQDSPSQLADSF